MYLFFLIGMSLAPLALNALPKGEKVKAGSATFHQLEEGKLQIRTSHRAIVNYSSFNIESSESVEFVQPKRSSTVLNRVVTEDPSLVMGKLKGNGRVLLVNANGVFFGREAVVEAGSFIASTLEIRNEDFLNDRFCFYMKPGSENARIVNQGSITTDPEGLLALLAPNLTNEGTLLAEQGKAVLFAGDALMGFLMEKGEILNAGRLNVATRLVEENGVVHLTGSLRADEIAVQAEELSVHGELIAEKALYLEGREKIEIQTGIVSGGSLTFVSNNSIQADGHFYADGDLAFLKLNGEPNDFVSLIDPIISVTGSVTFGAYTGPSLKVEAKGNITSTGNITITGPDTTACTFAGCTVDPDCAYLTSSPALILRAGETTLSSSCNWVTSMQSKTFGGATFTKVGGSGNTISLQGTYSGFEVGIFSGNIVLAGNTSILANGNQQLTINGSIDGAFNLNISAGQGTLSLNGPVGSTTPLLSIFGAGGNIFLSGTIEANALNLLAEKSILNTAAPQLIRLTSNGSFNALGGSVGTASSPIAVASGMLVFAGAQGEIAAFSGTTADGIIHAIPSNIPCPLLFNGITLIPCELNSGISKISARDFYVQGIYSQYDSLASDSYFFPEIVDPSYIEIMTPVFITRKVFSLPIFEDKLIRKVKEEHEYRQTVSSL